jgi:hypothetical protein
MRGRCGDETPTICFERVIVGARGSDAHIGPLGEVRRIVAVMILRGQSDVEWENKGLTDSRCPWVRVDVVKLEDI